MKENNPASPNEHVFYSEKDSDSLGEMGKLVVVSDLERRFLENSLLQASINYARLRPHQRVQRRINP